MISAQILQPLLDGGIHSVKFFNGRLLSAEDMQREQAAQREMRALLGQAIGDGVAYGLRVQSERVTPQPALRIQAGLAVNRDGDAVHLPDDVVLELTDTAALTSGASTSPSSAANFKQCNAPATGLYVMGNDLWILTALPAQGTKGRAPVTGLGNSATACNAKYVVDGVRFRLVQITGEFPPEALLDAALPRLRSTVAAACFDTSHALDLATDPFSMAQTGGGLVERLYERGLLKSCEVPLAVFHWSAAVGAQPAGFRFVDRWSVRRRVVLPHSSGRWGLTDARRASAEALVQQFQEQIDDLHVRTPEVIRASEHFTYLPPVGILPISGNPRRGGFVLDTFFTGLKIRPPVSPMPQPPPVYQAYTVIEASRVPALLDEALKHPPLDAASKEAIWIYQVRENIQATRVANSNVQPYVIFARGSVPYHGHANFDVSHWGYATFT